MTKFRSLPGRPASAQPQTLDIMDESSVRNHSSQPMMITQFRGVSDTTIHIVAATQIRWDGANALSEVRVLCSDSRAFKVYEIAPDFFDGLFHVTRPNGRMVDFALKNWAPLITLGAAWKEKTTRSRLSLLLMTPMGTCSLSSSHRLRSLNRWTR